MKTQTKIIGVVVELGIDIRRCYWRPRLHLSNGILFNWLYLRSWWGLQRVPVCRKNDSSILS